MSEGYPEWAGMYFETNAQSQIKLSQANAEIARLQDNLDVAEMWQSTWQQKSMEQNTEVARLTAELKAATQEAHTWKLRVDEAANMIDGLEAALAAANEREAFHPRAAKLAGKRKNFLVVAEDEVYFGVVYGMIRASEMSKGRWTDDDEQLYQGYPPPPTQEVEG